MDRIDTYNRKYSLAGYLLLLVLLLPPFALLIFNGYRDIPALVTDIAFLKQTGISLAIGAACTLASLILAFPGIAIYSKCGRRTRNLLRVFFSFAFCFPPVLMGICFDNLFGKGGYIIEINMAGLIRTCAISLMLNIPLIITMVGEHGRRLDNRCEENARTLGASRIRIFFSITLPKIRPALFGTCALVLLRNWLLSENAIISTVISLLILVVLVTSEKRISRVEMPADSNRPKRKANVFVIFLSFIYIVAVLAMSIVPALSMILRSVLIEGSISFGIYKTMFSVLNLDWLVALTFCLALAVASSLIASFIAVHISIGIASSGSSTFIAMIPFAMKSIPLALGFMGLYAWLPDTVVVKMILTLLCHILVLTSVQTMIVLPSMRALRKTCRETSLSLGYRNGTSFRRIDLKIIAADVRSAIFTAIALSLAGYGAAETFGLNTVYAQSLRLVEKGDMTQACAMGSVVLVLCFIFFSLGIGHSREGKRYA